MASLEVLNEERLKAYAKAAKETFARLEKLSDAKQQELLEYDSIIHKLEELPRKRMQSIMCPVGSVGFLPANIVHTNEVLVGLGDGYFLDTTCYDAVQILKRRKKVVEKGIADLHEHRKLLENYSTYAKRLFEHQGSSDEVEIREEYDEKKEDELRKKRKSRKMASRPATKTLAEISAEKELMKRLEELEQQELRNGELDSPFDIDASVGNEEAPPSLDTILEKLDDDDTKCLVSILASEKSTEAALPEEHSLSDDKPTTSTTNVEAVTSPEPSSQKEEGAGIRVAEIVELPIKKIKPSVLTATDSANMPPNDSTNVLPKGELSTGYFRGDDLMRMLAEQEQEYEENSQSYQPPPGISTEQAYQRLLRTVDEMEDDEESDDGDEEGENGRVLKEINGVRNASAPSTNTSHGSDLDSDDLAEPEPDGPVDFGPFTAVNLGTDAGLLEKDSSETKGATSVAPKASTSVPAEGEMKKLNKKKKSVVFAEKLEKAMTIDKNAPPSDVRAEPSTSSGTKSISILRNANEQTPVDHSLLSDSAGTQKVILPESKVAFTGIVQERNVEVLNDADHAVGDGDSSKPKSLFRMKRLRNHV